MDHPLVLDTVHRPQRTYIHAADSQTAKSIMEISSQAHIAASARDPLLFNLLSVDNGIFDSHYNAMKS